MGQQSASLWGLQGLPLAWAMCHSSSKPLTYLDGSFRNLKGWLTFLLLFLLLSALLSDVRWLLTWSHKAFRPLFSCSAPFFQFFFAKPCSLIFGPVFLSLSQTKSTEALVIDAFAKDVNSALSEPFNKLSVNHAACFRRFLRDRRWRGRYSVIRHVHIVYPCKCLCVRNFPCGNTPLFLLSYALRVLSH